MRPANGPLVAVSKAFGRGGAGGRALRASGLRRKLRAGRRREDRALRERGPERASPLALHRPDPEQQDTPHCHALRLGTLRRPAEDRRAPSSQRPAAQPPLDVLCRSTSAAKRRRAASRPTTRRARARGRASAATAVARPDGDSGARRRPAAAARALRAAERAVRGVCARAAPALDTLSMGMSDDLEAAIAEGATIVRVGTAIFGARQTKGRL